MSAIDLDAAIAALVITVPDSDTTKGNLTLHMRDMNHIPPELAEVDYPCFFPQPDGNFYKENDTTPGVFDQMVGREYSQFSLNYYLALAAVGSGRGIWEYYANSINLSVALKEKIRGIDLRTLTKIAGVTITGVRVLRDAADHPFHGCAVAVSAQEYLPEQG